MTITPEREQLITTVAQGLIGEQGALCPAARNALLQFNGLTADEAALFASIVFCCVSCGGWFSATESHPGANGGFICDADAAKAAP